MQSVSVHKAKLYLSFVQLLEKYCWAEFDALNLNSKENKPSTDKASSKSKERSNFSLADCSTVSTRLASDWMVSFRYFLKNLGGLVTLRGCLKRVAKKIAPASAKPAGTFGTLGERRLNDKI
ncbi:MAG: hypothetical protein D6742_20000 [Cyanobacteria bacterium J069]|nr:MAG: hypothetical protein D6742_20000 [Cyanobacteria bacterium J069]